MILHVVYRKGLQQLHVALTVSSTQATPEVVLSLRLEAQLHQQAPSAVLHFTDYMGVSQY